MTRQELSLSVLARAGFSDLTQAKNHLGTLEQSLPFAANHLDAISRAADPDAAVQQLLMLANHEQRILAEVVANPRALEHLYTVLGSSQGLGEFWYRNPAELMLCFEEPELPSTSLLRSDFEQVLQQYHHVGEQRSVVALRVAYRRNLARIALWDLRLEVPEAAIQQVTATLSELADIAVETSLQLARLQSGFAEAELPELAVIAMGKAGAQELNYISDVDVIFVAEGVAGLAEEQVIPRATTLAKRLIANLSDANIEPMLWEVDTNLRPEGKAGALVRTLESHLAYYDRWAESWEFQALLKARTMAGSHLLGQRYEQAIAERVWNSASRSNFVESVQVMRERVTDNIPVAQLDRQIKLGPGGIRDIEFTVQLLQLVHGVVDETIRQRSTLEALEALTTQTYIGREEAAEFARYYRILRLLEHRLQLRQLKRTHLMPNEENALRVLARSSKLGKTSAEMSELWNSVKKEVRSLHEKLFYRPLLSAVSQLDRSDFALTSEQAAARLEAIGFRDSAGALKHISAMISGVTRSAQIQRTLLPVMLQWLAEGVEPDYGLLCLRRLSDELGTTHWYLRMLRDSSGAAYRLTQLLSGSRFIGELLGSIPEATAWLEDNDTLQPRSLESLREEASTLLDPESELDDIARRLLLMRRREVLRTAMSWALGAITIRAFGESLSAITTALVSGLLDRLVAVRAPDLEFAIVAMGRYGGEELGLASDADVIVLYRGKNTQEDAQRRATAVVTELKQLATDPMMQFQLDFDLRPEGKNGPLIRSFESYQAYYERFAEIWEFQALLRARPVAGSVQLQQDFVTLIDQYRYLSGLDTVQLREIRRIKARVEAERLPRGADPMRHLKLGRGSLSDVEWLVQLMQLRFAHQNPELRVTGTLEALSALEAHEHLSATDAQILREAWMFASELRSAITLVTAKGEDVLPMDLVQLESIARVLRYPPGSAVALNERYLRITRRARQVYERIFYS